jgi:enoyl-[acyl-carrier-protein] reductase (NADH)
MGCVDSLHVASDASSFITGTALLVDGGASINRTLDDINATLRQFKL